MSNLYTKSGDKGQTSLYGGKRVDKNSLKVDCYGTMDEANSMIGMAYTLVKNDNSKNYINTIQIKIFSVGAELASDEKGLEMLKDKVDERDVNYLEKIVDECTEIVGKQTDFVVPGKNLSSSALHIARTIVRRAERKITQLKKEEDIREDLLKYVNRLSDALYALARLEEYRSSIGDIEKRVKEILSEKLSYVEFNLSTAKKMAEYAMEKAKQLNIDIVFSAVDSGGNLILLNRMENSLIASIDISINKAYTAMILKMPTNELNQLAREDGDLFGIQNSNNNRIITFGGGIPIKIKDNFVGAIGVSGGTVDEDVEVALYSIEKLIIGG